MRKELFSPKATPSILFTDIPSLRQLLHTRWMLSDEASLSLFCEEDGMRIVALDSEVHAPLSHALSQAEAIVRDKKGKVTREQAQEMIRIRSRQVSE